MVFSSSFFVSVFFPLLLIIYFLSGKSYRNSILLIFSIFFYTWGDPKALPLLLATIAANYLLGLQISRSDRGKFWLICGICVNLGLLAVFKYLDFLIKNLNVLLNCWQLPSLPEPNIGLPIGISFYIFQAISYIIDIYRKAVAPQRSPFRFALYISLFPQLIAGPIVRYISIENDLNNRVLIPTNIRDGLIRFCVGLAKKVFIADNLGYVADCIFNSPVNGIPCFWAWIGALTYAFQIYYDFSAYSDMAIGIGKIFNFHFPENFNYPYAARTLQDFWRRWHMSLTEWLKDYLYIPLGGSRGSLSKTRRNILIVLLCCGIWHGAAWNFLIWGLYNGIGLIFERVIFSVRDSSVRGCLRYIISALHHCLTLLFILVGWVIFRCESAEQTLQYLRIMFCGNPAYSFYSLEIVWNSCVTFSNMLFFLLAFIFTQPYRFLTFEKAASSYMMQGYVLILFVVTYAFVLTTNYSPFLYFRF